MGKSKKKMLANGRSDAEQFIAVPYRMAQSAAWRSLSGAAVKVWVELHTRFHGRNNGLLSLSLEDGARLLGIGKSTVGRALKELEAKGFIKLIKRGQFSGRMASEYALTTKHFKGHPPTHDWRHWTPSRKPQWGGQKQNPGSVVAHIAPVTGPHGNRRNADGATTKPVNGNFGASIGSEMGHLYTSS